MCIRDRRQAVPLLRPEAPIVGTGMEHKICLDSEVAVLAEGDGVVTCLLYTSPPAFRRDAVPCADCPVWSGGTPTRCSAPAAWDAPRLNLLFNEFHVLTGIFNTFSPDSQNQFGIMS